MFARAESLVFLACAQGVQIFLAFQPLLFLNISRESTLPLQDIQNRDKVTSVFLKDVLSTTGGNPITAA